LCEIAVSHRSKAPCSKALFDEPINAFKIERSRPAQDSRIARHHEMSVTTFNDSHVGETARTRSCASSNLAPTAPQETMPRAPSLAALDRELYPNPGPMPDMTITLSREASIAPGTMDFVESSIWRSDRHEAAADFLARESKLLDV